MADADEERNSGSRNVNYECDVCGKQLSRKQRLQSHLSTAHGINVENTRRYKKYVADPTYPIPKRTLIRMKKMKEELKNTDPVNDSPQLVSTINQEAATSTLNKQISDEHEQLLNHQYLDCGSSSDYVTMQENHLTEAVPQPVSTINEDIEETMDNPCISDNEHTNNRLIDSVSFSSTLSNLLEDVCNQHQTVLDGYLSSESDYDHLTDYSSDTSELNFSDGSDTENFSDEDNQSTCGSINRNADEDKHLSILYLLKYNLNGQASKDLIEMMSMLSDDNSSLKGISLNTIKSSVITSEILLKDFCEQCFSLFPDDLSVDRCTQINCNHPRYKGSKENQKQLKHKRSYFTCLSPCQQIIDILKRDGVWKCIQEYKMKSRNATDILDITSGSLYRNLCKEGNFLNNDNNLTMLFNTDGIPLYKSSSVSIWPLYLVINELPPKLRFSKKNMILWGVWQGKGKLVFQTFLQPFIEDMQKLKCEGFTLEIGGQSIEVKAMLLAGTMDMQAKAYTTEMTQHNGQFGCLTCENPEQVMTQGKGYARAYTPMESTRRTTDGLVQCATEASATNVTVKGVKGVSALLGLDWFDMVNGLGPDYMHGVLLGVTKKMLQLHLSAAHSKKKYSIASHIKTIDKHLKKMKPNDDIGRLPRSLENNIHHMKAPELQNWLLFYSLPCLIDHLEKKYFDHFALFVEGVYILLGDSISAAHIARAETVLLEFYNQFGELYGENNCTLNLHNACCHLSEYVKLIGPLWAWSCFPFENMNGSILNCVHGTGDVCLQVLWVLQAQKWLAVESNLIQDTHVKAFTDRMISTKRALNVTKRAQNCQILGGMTSREIDPAVQTKVEILLGVDAGKLMYCLRILVKNTVFFSKAYERHTKRICHYVLVKINDESCIAVVEHFLYHEEKNLCLAVIQRVSLEENEPLVQLYVDHLLKIMPAPSEVKEVVMGDQLEEKLMFMNGNKKVICISRLPNLHGLCC